MTSIQINSSVADTNTIKSKLRYGGTAAWEELLSPNPSTNISHNRNGKQVTRYFKVSQTDVDAFVAEGLPDYGMPAQHPAAYGLFIDSIDLAPFGGDAGAFSYHDWGGVLPDVWLATVVYSPWPENTNNAAGATPPPSPSGASNGFDYLTGSLNLTTETMTVPSDGFRWEDKPAGTRNNENIDAAIIIPIQDFEFQRQRVSTIPYSQIMAAAGCVCDSTWQRWPAETLLYLGARITFTFNTTGARTYNIHHHYKGRQIKVGSAVYGWNHFYRREDRTWKKLLGEGNNPLYKAVNVATFNAALA